VLDLNGYDLSARGNLDEQGHAAAEGQRDPGDPGGAIGGTVRYYGDGGANRYPSTGRWVILSNLAFRRGPNS